ncbi:protein lin-37 homolog [Pocillopora verrucosa]|uniref:protein lin-37 homolog n=1 Tax=Pocillopora verrucosa TaxID=203993 RepID=UPI00333F68AB
MAAKREETTSGVKSARVRLDVLLKDLIKKTEESGEGETSSTTGSSAAFQMPPPSTPTKRSGSGKTPRKRRKKDVGYDDADGSSQNRIFVMKLFDRSVDFAQFNEDTTLYALARAWMQNKPYGTKPSDSQEGNQDGESPTSSQESVMSSLSHSNGDSDPKNVYSFPDPVKSIEDFKMNSTLSKGTLSLDIHYDIDKAPPVSDLKRNHMDRWKKVKSNWKDSSFKRQACYAPSIKKIRELFEHQ